MSNSAPLGRRDIEYDPSPGMVRTSASSSGAGHVARYAFATFPNLATAMVSVLLLCLPLFLPSVTLASQIVILATGALSCTLLLGGLGLLSFGQGLFFGVGAYSMGLLLRDASLDVFSAFFIATSFTALVAMPIGWLIVRRRGVYFVMLTFAFAQTGFFAMNAAGRVTGGENGLRDVPRIGALTDGSTTLTYVILALIFIGVFVVVQRLQASPLGTVFAAIRGNEERSEAVGYDVRAFKLVAFVVAACIAGIAGAMNTIFLGFVPPSAIDIEMSERLIIVSLIGGVSSPAGALLGAMLYGTLADVIGHLWPRWLMVIAVLLILIVMFFKEGLVGAVERFIGHLSGRWSHDDAAKS